MSIRDALRKIKGFIRSNAFVRMVLSYLVVILASVVVYCLMYSYAFDNMHNYILSTGSGAQGDAVNQIENLLSGADAALIQMSNDIQIQRFQNVKSPIGADDYMSLYTIKNTLQNYKALNPNIYNLSIYFKNSGCICSHRAATARLELAYYTEYGCEGMTYGEWQDVISPARPTCFLPAMPLINKRSSVVTYMRKFPCNYVGKDSSTAIVQFETSVLSNILRTGFLTQSVDSCLIDNNEGSLIFRCNTAADKGLSLDQLLSVRVGCTEMNVGGNDNIVFRTEIPAYGLSCITAFDVNTLMAETTHHKMILLGVLLGALAVELVYVLMVSRLNYRPIQAVMELLPEKPAVGESELASIYTSVMRMNAESEMIRKQLDDQQETIRKLCLSKLLGLEPGLGDIDFVLSKLPASCPSHFVFIIYTSSSDAMDGGISTGRACVAKLEGDLLRQHVADSVISFDYFTNSTAFILSTAQEDGMGDSIAKLTELLFASPFDFAVGIGLPANDLNQISRSFSEARLAAQEAKSTGSRVVLYRNTPSRHNAYNYSSELEATLEQNIISGNCEKAIGIINNVYWKTREAASMPTKLQLLLNEIYGTLLKIRQYNHLDSQTAEREFYFLLNEIEFNTNLYQRYNSILQAVRYYCGQVAENKLSATPSLYRRVSDYISEHYADPDLCLDAIAARFEVSPKYLSRHFKEQSASNISTFITNMRMKQAGLLLQNRAVGVAQVAEMCGYANTNTFYKAFKRYWGMNPGNFRDENVIDGVREPINQEIEETDDEDGDLSASKPDDGV